MKSVFAALFLLATPAAAAQPACPAPQTIATVDGMVCDMCAQSIKKVLEKEPSVKSVAIDLTSKEVLIAVKPGETLSDDIVKEKIDWAGYKLTALKHACAAPPGKT